MNNKKTIYGIIFVLICLVGIGYAALVSNITITGTAAIKSASFDVHFENITLTNGSVDINTTAGDSAATIEPTNRTRIDYSVTLEEPGDFYEFTVDVVNAGSMDAMINTVTSKMNNVVINNNLPDYLEYNVTYVDGIAIEPNHELNATQVETYKVRVAYRTDINPSDLPNTASTLNFSFRVNYIQKDSNAIAKPFPTFAKSSWSQIASVANMDNPCEGPYSVGDTKEVDMGTFGTHTVRIANCSKPAECKTTGFSQTACGLVIEFADVITIYNMNNTNNPYNVGGWPASLMRTYLNETIYDALPNEMRNSIIDTTVVTGHGSNVSSNFTTRDKLYLLSLKEVGAETSIFDSATAETRKLDYYILAGNSVRIKQFNGTDSTWWTRTPSKQNSYDMYYLLGDGNPSVYYANSIYGVSPAFRVG